MKILRVAVCSGDLLAHAAAGGVGPSSSGVGPTLSRLALAVGPGLVLALPIESGAATSIPTLEMLVDVDPKSDFFEPPVWVFFRARFRF